MRVKCPIDGTDLTMSDRQGIEIDYCPKCRGVWLDRGELDKIIERSDAAPQPARAQPYRERPQEFRPDHGYRPDSGHRDGYGYDKRRRKKSLLGEIFDFD
ncbi:hypothetical protein IZ6_10680 [Terrihabitans soli]|uniref:Transcription factor zinc-finger domain-containing protein n=1 Tax=Terrihabitans soli TaxID=708113 RepID=A0A6S6QGR4_9HYPH|nr:zf-TFIIB domain-containing protein [Terrihabitans soli]BCJ90333.1 hypothetical protein IZ6_10680 [Terrihabitans soli]